MVQNPLFYRNLSEVEISNSNLMQELWYELYLLVLASDRRPWMRSKDGSFSVSSSTSLWGIRATPIGFSFWADCSSRQHPHYG